MTEMITTPAAQQGAAAPAEETIIQWLKGYISDVLAVPVEKINAETSFQQMGLDSSAAVGMTGDLGEWLKQDIDAAAAYDYPNIRALASAVASSRQV